ncbi:MAG: TonB family protein [Pseudomonadota bacterium]
MNTMTLTNTASAGWDRSAQDKRGQIGKIAAIVALHAGVFYLLHTGMLREAVRIVMPPPVTVTFVTPPAPPEQAPPPKTVQIAHQAPVIAPPPLPLLNIVVENTITVPPSQPRTTTEAPSAPVAAPSAPAAPPAVVSAPSTPRTVQGVEYLRAPQPVYPSISRRLGETGVVMLRVLISEKGLPEQAIVQKSSGSGNLDEAGRQAALRSVFKPYVEDGKPVAVYVIVPINFQLS